MTDADSYKFGGKSSDAITELPISIMLVTIREYIGYIELLYTGID